MANRSVEAETVLAQWQVDEDWDDDDDPVQSRPLSLSSCSVACVLFRVCICALMSSVVSFI